MVVNCYVLFWIWSYIAIFLTISGICRFGTGPCDLVWCSVKFRRWMALLWSFFVMRNKTCPCALGCYSWTCSVFCSTRRGRTKRVGCMLVISSLRPLLKFFSGVPLMIANSDGDTFLLQTRVLKFLFPWHPLLFAFISFCGRSVCTGSLHPMGWTVNMRPFFVLNLKMWQNRECENPPMNLSFVGISVALSRHSHGSA